MLWWKAIHIIAVISWMAGLLYLFRLFVYHNQEIEVVVKERFAIMERRLLFVITTPAAILTLASGIAILVLYPSFFKEGWLYAKLILVVMLVVVHQTAFRILKKLSELPHPYNNVWLRFLNEVPTLLMIGIVLLVILKPF